MFDYLLFSVFNQRRESREKWEGKQNVRLKLRLSRYSIKQVIESLVVSPFLEEEKAVYLSNQDI